MQKVCALLKAHNPDIPFNETKPKIVPRPPSRPVSAKPRPKSAVTQKTVATAISPTEIHTLNQSDNGVEALKQVLGKLEDEFARLKK